MNWETLTDRWDFEGIMDLESGDLKDVQKVTMCFSNDSSLNEILIELKDGRTLYISAKDVNTDGERSELFASSHTPI